MTARDLKTIDRHIAEAEGDLGRPGRLVRLSGDRTLRRWSGQSLPGSFWRSCLVQRPAVSYLHLRAASGRQLPFRLGRWFRLAGKLLLGAMPVIVIAAGLTSFLFPQ